MKRIGILVFLCLWLPVLTGCGGNDGTSQPPPNSLIMDPPSHPADPPAYEPAIANIKPWPGEPLAVIPYPIGINWIGDIAFGPATATLWMLVGDLTALPNWIAIDPFTGSIVGRLPNPETATVNHGSEVAFDGSNLWATSSGLVSGSTGGVVYKLDASTGAIADQFPCPATSTGDCEGLAWDGEYFWSGASDNRDLVRFDQTGKVVTIFKNFWASANLGQDISFDPVSSQIMAQKTSQLIFIDPATEDLLEGRVLSSEPVPGAWANGYYWQVDNDKKEIEVIKISPSN